MAGSFIEGNEPSVPPEPPSNTEEPLSMDLIRKSGSYSIDYSTQQRMHENVESDIPLMPISAGPHHMSHTLPPQTINWKDALDVQDWRKPTKQEMEKETMNCNSLIRSSNSFSVSTSIAQTYSANPTVEHDSPVHISNSRLSAAEPMEGAFPCLKCKRTFPREDTFLKHVCVANGQPQGQIISQDKVPDKHLTVAENGPDEHKDLQLSHHPKGYYVATTKHGGSTIASSHSAAKEVSTKRTVETNSLLQESAQQKTSIQGYSRHGDRLNTGAKFIDSRNHVTTKASCSEDVMCQQSSVLPEFTALEYAAENCSSECNANRATSTGPILDGNLDDAVVMRTEYMSADEKQLKTDSKSIWSNDNETDDPHPPSPINLSSLSLPTCNSVIVLTNQNPPGGTNSIKNDKYKCGKCAYIAPNRRLFNMHIIAHKHSNHICPYCQRACLNAGQLNQHIWYKHRTENQICMCKSYPACNHTNLKKFPKNYKWINQIWYFCVKCTYSCTSQPDFDIHCDSHKRDKHDQSQCLHCNKVFHTVKEMKTHNCPCEPESISGSSFSSTCNNATHPFTLSVPISEDNVVENKIYWCAKCSYAPPSLELLNIHCAKKHSMHNCPYCRKKYVHERQLKIHIWYKHRKKHQICTCKVVSACRHTNLTHPKFDKSVKPIWYYCIMCMYSCTSQRDLDVHCDSHQLDQDDQIKCPNCNKEFYSANNLKTHNCLNEGSGSISRSSVSSTCSNTTNQVICSGPTKMGSSKKIHVPPPDVSHNDRGKIKPSKSSPSEIICMKSEIITKMDTNQECANIPTSDPSHVDNKQGQSSKDESVRDKSTGVFSTEDTYVTKRTACVSLLQSEITLGNTDQAIPSKYHSVQHEKAYLTSPKDISFQDLRISHESIGRVDTFNNGMCVASSLFSVSIDADGVLTVADKLVSLSKRQQSNVTFHKKLDMFQCLMKKLSDKMDKEAVTVSRSRPTPNATTNTTRTSNSKTPISLLGKRSHEQDCRGKAKRCILPCSSRQDTTFCPAMAAEPDGMPTTGSPSASRRKVGTSKPIIVSIKNIARQTSTNDEKMEQAPTKRLMHLTPQNTDENRKKTDLKNKSNMSKNSMDISANSTQHSSTNRTNWHHKEMNKMCLEHHQFGKCCYVRMKKMIIV